MFRKHLEGREFTIQLVEEVAKHPNDWLRNVFQHYIQYPYYKCKISPETQAGYSESCYQEATITVDIIRSLNSRLRALYSRTAWKISVDRQVEDVPGGVGGLISIASRLILGGPFGEVVDLLAHTVIGVREMGQQLLWFNDFYIYFESKTKVIHKAPGLSPGEGYMGYHILRPARSIIHELHGPRASTRMIHYLLKEQSWFEYPSSLILEFYYDKINRPVYLSARDPNTDNELYSYGARSENGEKHTRLVVIPREYLDKENEETRFYGLAGLYQSME